MESKTAGEMMIPIDSYPHIPYWFTVRQAVAEIYHAQLEVDGRKSLARALLVFDEEYKLLGIVRRRDILRGLEPENFFGDTHHHPKAIFDSEIDPNLLEISHANLLKVIEERSSQPISDFMIPIKHTVDYNDHLVKIIYEMNKFQLSLLPVLKDKSAVGVLRTVEVMNEIAKILEID